MKKLKAVILLLILIFSISAITFGIDNLNEQKENKKPVIGISASMFRTLASTTIKSYINEYYVNAVSDAGGIPIVLPITDDESVIPGMVSVIDGLILSGGADVNPLIYGEEPHPALEKLMPRRDTFETKLLKTVIDKGLPVFGICRGEQFINVFHGGTLYQDIHKMTDSDVRHRQLGNQEMGTHTIDVKEGSWLHGVLGKKTVVNSYHHQAVKDLAPGFEVVARSKDGTIEAIEKKEGPFCVAVQWHPEMMQKNNKLMNNLFKEFIKECAKNEAEK